MTGTTIAHYKVTAKIGAGGMGEVYRATDTKLSRDVALKVLPELFAKDAERMARFSREAQLLAALNHPNIAAIYGLEEDKGIRALVLELVEGPTLAERIQEGPLPVDEALPIAKQMADALEAAHDQGIIHRDLKPANVKVKEDGQVKVLDFGLAKALEDDTAETDPGNSPTLSMAATRAGVILGTAAYMSPEQVHGRKADRRADIWSFGVVLYEMLTGKRAFEGESISDILASVLKFDPDWDALPAELPVTLHKLLRRCLTKDRKLRLQAIGEARIAIAEFQADSAAASVMLPGPVAEPAPLWQRALPWALLGVMTLALVSVAWSPWQAAEPPAPPMRLSVDVAGENTLGVTNGAHAILSPDGARLVFRARGADQKWRLYTRPLDQLQATLLSGTEDAHNHFFSPDGQWVGFFAGDKLKKISVLGGAAVTLCDAPNNRGGSWGEDGFIIAALNRTAGLSRIPEAGGEPEPVIELDEEKQERTLRYPQVLPGAKAVLFTAHTATGGNFDEANIELQVLATGERKTLHRGGYYGRYLPSGLSRLSRANARGHLVYVHEGTLFAAPFDLDRLEVTGQPAPVLEEVASFQVLGTAQFDFSRTGTFVYLPGRAAAGGWGIHWLESDGKTQPLRETPAVYLSPQFSPDGSRLAVRVVDQGGAGSDVWVYEWQRDTMTRLTFDPAIDGSPVWTPDGLRIAFRSERGTNPGNIYWRRADGAGEAQQLTDSKNQQVPQSFSPDGKRLAFVEESPETGWDIWTLPIEGGDPGSATAGQPELFLGTPFTEVYAAFSPDGRWLAYASTESGGIEVYVRPYTGPGGQPSAAGKWQISTGGGRMPVWSPNGRELFYRQGSRIMVSNYSAEGNSFRADKPRLWSEKRFTSTGIAPNFALAPDGKRFAVMLAPESAEEEADRTHVTFILNFFEELERIAPTSGN